MLLCMCVSLCMYYGGQTLHWLIQGRNLLLTADSPVVWSIQTWRTLWTSGHTHRSDVTAGLFFRKEWHEMQNSDGWLFTNQFRSDQDVLTTCSWTGDQQLKLPLPVKTQWNWHSANSTTNVSTPNMSCHVMSVDNRSIQVHLVELSVISRQKMNFEPKKKKKLFECLYFYWQTPPADENKIKFGSL